MPASRLLGNCAASFLRKAGFTAKCWRDPSDQLDERIGLLATVDCPGVFVVQATHARISNHSIATISPAAAGRTALATRCAACVCSMKNEDAQYSRCLAPTCPRLLKVMPEDVSPRDNRDQDHAQRDRFEILCELRRVHARPPLR